MVRTSEHDVQGWSVNDEHPKTSTSQDSEEIVYVANDALAKGEREFSFDGKHLRKT